MLKISHLHSLWLFVIDPFLECVFGLNSQSGFPTPYQALGIGGWNWGGGGGVGRGVHMPIILSSVKHISSPNTFQLNRSLCPPFVSRIRSFAQSGDLPNTAIRLMSCPNKNCTTVKSL